MKTSWLSVLILVVVGGCGGLPSLVGTSEQTPISQRPTKGDAQRGAKAHYDLGMMYLGEGQYNVALEEARKSIDADATYPLAYNLLGLVQMYLGENEAADESFSRALLLAPSDPEINNNYGWFLCRNKRELASIPYFDVAAKNPMFKFPTKPLTNAAVCAISGGNDALGERYLTDALKADPTNDDARFVLASHLYRTQRYDLAREQVQVLERSSPPSAQLVWLALRIERKLDNRAAEGQYASQLRREFRNSREYELMSRGVYP